MGMLVLLSLWSLLQSPPVTAPVSWSFASSVDAGGVVQVQLTAHIEEGWHIYATELPSDLGPIPTSIRVAPSDAYTVAGDLGEPVAVEEFDPNFGMVVRHHSGTPRFVIPIKPAVSGTFTVEGEVEYMVCNDKTCLPPVAVPFKLTVQAPE